ncbi:MAG: LuxR family transcriptional regulator [Actinobacteria bacterium]|nr:MAG: LuxR family transcriptional regulator [Actinomycetota bacterium]
MHHAGTVELLERDRELEQLDRLVTDACAGRGRLVLVEGPPGIGKTSLLEAARDRARERDMTVLAARASELDRDFPFGVVRQLFEPLVAAAAAPRRATLLHGAAALAAPLLGGGAPEPAAGKATGDPALRLFHALYWLTANLAEQTPAALAIDDAHWADAGSLRFFQFLAARLDELSVLVALTARTAGPTVERQPIDALATDPLAVVLRPAPLSHRAVAALVADRLRGAPDASFCDACREVTGGNPFLLRELLREVAADEVAPIGAHVSLVRQLAPPTVARAVLLRLARLGDDAAALAGAVAVLGDGTPLRRAAALAGLPVERADGFAATLVEADILAAERPLAFAHPVLRSAIYADLDPGARSRAHRRAAALLADEGAAIDAIAVHLLATEPAGDRQVVATLREAALRALARGAAATAVACLRRALAEPPATSERAAFVLELAAAELAAGEPAAAADHFEAGLRVTGDVRARAGCVRKAVLALQTLGRHDEGFALLERVVDEAAAVDPDLAQSIEGDLIASATLERSRRAWALDRLDRYGDQLTAATSGSRKLLATRAALDAFSSECETPAETLANAAERALGGGRLLDDGPSTPFFFAIIVLLLADRIEPARRALDRAVDDARRHGSAPQFAFAAGWRCWLLAREGHLAEAEADARSSAELALSQGWFVMGPVILGYVLEVLIDRGELEDAHRLLERSGMVTRTADRDATFDDVVHARALLRAARGDLDAAREDLARLARRRARWNTYPTLVPAVLAAPAAATDDQDEGRARADRMLREAQTWGTPRAIGMALRAAGLVEGGARGLELLAEAAMVLERSPAPLEHARALLDLGAGLRRANRRAAARDPLRQALDLADACGARPLADRARQELRAAGARPRRPRLGGVHALTASERRIAAMAAQGCSNPEIAQALFVTTKTVETHLSNAYRKLAIHSRAQLGDALNDGRP